VEFLHLLIEAEHQVTDNVIKGIAVLSAHIIYAFIRTYAMAYGERVLESLRQQLSKSFLAASAMRTTETHASQQIII